MTSDPGPTVVTGIKPTGTPHLGNYLGMIRPTLRLAARHPAYVFVADAHAMTTVAGADALATGSREVAATLLACGLDPSRTALYRQSDVLQVFELAWTLSCLAPKGLLNRAHAYKAAVDANDRAGRPADDGVSTGLFTYPVLMAADVLAIGGTLVPVGRDQLQHLEIARRLASAFDRRYGPVLAVPEAAVEARIAAVVGTDGRKMSKSHDNVVPLFAPSDEVARRVRAMVTDSRPPTAVKDPDRCPLFGLYREVAHPGAAAELGGRYRTGGVGYAEVKERLAAALEEHLGAARRRYEALMADPVRIDHVLAAGAERARARASAVLARVRRVRGLAG